MMRCHTASQTPQQVAYVMASMMEESPHASFLFKSGEPINPIDARSQSTAVVIGASSESFYVIAHTGFIGISDELLFHHLAAQWREESALLSSTTEMVMLSPYQRIMAMGEKAIPFIMRELESENGQPDNWFWALRHITGENPVAPERRGNRRAMARAWLDWARGRYDW